MDIDSCFHLNTSNTHTSIQKSCIFIRSVVLIVLRLVLLILVVVVGIDLLLLMILLFLIILMVVVLIVLLSAFISIPALEEGENTAHYS